FFREYVQLLFSYYLVNGLLKSTLMFKTRSTAKRLFQRTVSLFFSISKTVGFPTPARLANSSCVSPAFLRWSFSIAPKSKSCIIYCLNSKYTLFNNMYVYNSKKMLFFYCYGGN